MNHVDSLFLQLAVVLGLSATLGYFMKRLRLPLIVAYLVTGVLLSWLKIFDVGQSEALTLLPEIGIALVLFFVGMELSLKEIKSLGKPIVAASLIQIILSILAGFVISRSLNFSQTESLFLGFALAFSSTIVVVKMLLEKKDLNSLYGRLSIGILLLEDLTAIILLMVMTVGSSFLNLGFQHSLPMLTLFGKGAVLLILALGLSKYVLAKVFKAVAQSSELLFLSAVGWCFIFVAVSILMGFSVVIGAFLAGVALADSPFHYEIQGKVKPLRDFFVTLFFVYLGSQVVFEDLSYVLPLVGIFTSYALIVKPIIFLAVLGMFGLKKHTLYQTALVLSQISEFSLIIMVVGLKLGIVSQSALTAVALSVVLSIIASSIMISYSRPLYKVLAGLVGFFEIGKLKQDENRLESLLDGHIVLIGAHRMGGEIVKFLKRETLPFLVLDFNPKVIQSLVDDRVHALYGDVGDPEILEFLNLEKAKILISTAQDLDDNLILLSEIKRRKINTVTIVRASSIPEAKLLYDVGADYVVLPEIMSGEFLARELKAHWPRLDFFKDRKDVELAKLLRNTLAA